VQGAVFRDSGAQAVVEGAVRDGYHGAVLAYGQTGAGKTHTMQGTRRRVLELCNASGM
jgi:chromosomal replication initiation ATPase DnaA